ncbi:unnamed protein product [Rhizoctonia solani]|uniref:Xylanolytic transcriptional activator regulatory domain-containing protein n=1 Tax=Rhizoctonia solani TaxID=456999 RepID=A0A8H3GVB4_9AGAM|nr:unnamed protein product [Rhizoctonia solani]
MAGYQHVHYVIERVPNALIPQIWSNVARRNYVVALEARISLLEKILKDAESSDTTGSPNSSASQSDENDTLPQSFRTASNSSPPAPPANPASEPRLTLIEDGGVLEQRINPTVSLDTSQELDLGMTGYKTLLSLEQEHKLLAQFWDWQRMHHPYVVPVPFLSVYAIHSELDHPGEPIPRPPPPPPNSFAAATLNVPRASIVQRAPDLPHFISPLLLYSMFAIAALFSGDPGTGIMFYQHAKETLFREAANPKVATVQAVCLMATWELGHARSPAAWTLLGVALSLCIRLGLNVDATPLLRSGGISQRLYETRNFVFWGAFNTDRFLALCMGMRPLMDRQIISTPDYSSPTAESRQSKIHPRDMMKEICEPWWSPRTSGIGNVLIQAAWDAFRELTQIMDDLFDSVYKAGAPARTPQEILELIDRNHLTVQKLIDDLPTWLRSTGAIRRKDNGIVYLHLFIHVTSILTNRPFLSAHHSPQTPQTPLIRHYRTLAFRIARASALQVSSLIRHIPLSSPCVSIPYIVYSACTILLLAPEDPAAMDGVRTSLACLDGMDETGYWVESARDAARRVRALAHRWGVRLETSRRILGLAGGGSGGKVHRTSLPRESERPASPDPSTGLAGADIAPESGLLKVPRADAWVTGNAYIPRPAQSGFGVPEYEDYSSESLEAMLTETLDAGVNWALEEVQHSQDAGCTIMGLPNHPFHLPIEQTGSGACEPVLSSGQQSDLHTSVQYQPLLQRAQESNSYHYYKQNLHRSLPHVAYANSHADPQHDMHLPHSHWHAVIPPTDLDLLLPPDPSACADLGTCFSYTVEHAQDPAFIDLLADPYMGVSMDWIKDSGSNFPRYAGPWAESLGTSVGEHFGQGDGYEFM